MTNEGVSSRREAERLSSTIRSLERIVNAIADPVFVKDQQHRWVYLNDACCQFMGYPREALLGKTDVDFFPPEEAKVFWDKDEEVFAREIDIENEEDFTDAAGILHRIITKKSVYTDDQGQKFIVGVIRDITERKQMEEALRKSEARFKELSERLREVDQLKSNFVGAVSHELRTPLTSIKGYAEFLEEGIAGPVTNEQRDFVERIMEGASRLERLVDDLLDFARLESGSFKLVKRDMDMGVLLEEVQRSIAPLAREKHVEMEISREPAEQPLVGDPGRLGQVLTNLIGNALKFTPEGGRIKVTSALQEAGLKVSVEDTGAGIAPEHLPHLFERFYQADPGNTRKTGGTGLGLTISKALVEAHGGTIGVESRIDAGTTFWFSLPLGRQL